ncbi:TetR/AcrR family transcriptional regulator [Archangium lipolyticum]|uniref:TetR/AcrR family transcriptional regulator n=1 Tax=Archangium lipolyticum TaxID=2970465 RepID=UPI002149C3DD|nr:TetR/AcrR family transcriptional regulator [Archangium lipolyticum]
MGAKRKTSRKKRALVRGEPVVRGVLEATLEELAVVGYGALRIDDVAARAGVNKTTIYRRWPTKQELVEAALHCVVVARVVPPDTGSLRGDLLETGRHMASLMRSAEGQALRRILIAEERNPEFTAIASLLRGAMDALPLPVIEAARTRGELAPGLESVLPFRVLAASIQHRLFMEGRDIDEGYLAQLVDLILLGALAPDKRK